MGTGTSVLVFRSMLRAGVEGLDQSSMRNVRAANELMRAAAGQGQNKDGTTYNERSIADGGRDDFAGGLDAEEYRTTIGVPRGQRGAVRPRDARSRYCFVDFQE
jgi:hypothetical protein